VKHSFHRSLHFYVASYVLMGEAETGMREQVRYIRLVSRHQVVQTENVPTLLEHQFAEMRTQKSCSACDDCAQTRISYSAVQQVAIIPEKMFTLELFPTCCRFFCTVLNDDKWRFRTVAREQVLKAIEGLPSQAPQNLSYGPLRFANLP